MDKYANGVQQVSSDILIQGIGVPIAYTTYFGLYASGKIDEKKFDQLIDELGNDVHQRFDKYAGRALSLPRDIFDPSKTSDDIAMDVEQAFYIYSAIAGIRSYITGSAGKTMSIEGMGKTGADNIATGPKLNAQLTYEEASSIFTRSGTLQPEVIKNSSAIIPGNEINNPSVINALTKNGSNINDWAKMTTQTFKSPSGDFQVHFYQNLKTGEVSTYELKVKFNK